MLLASDIGGTKLHFGIFSKERGPRRPLVEAIYRSSDFKSLEEATRRFLEETGPRITRAVFGVAGPVVGGSSQITNLPWVIDEVRLRKALKIPAVRLVNDVEAIASFVPFLRGSDLVTLQRGAPARRGSMAVIAPGTGLGEAWLAWDGQGYRAYPSEGGHADFAARSEMEDELLAYLRDRHGHVSYELVCSGIGIVNIYRFLRDKGHAKEPDWLSRDLARLADPVPVIVEKALDPENSCDICVRALDLFASVLGAEAGNLALKIMATGGVYLGGGIPPRILPFLKENHFTEAFLRKGRMRDLMARIPVHVISNPKTALLGAAALGLGSETRKRSRSSR
ncbi:MAG TPA: glucokinase [Syntrophales bacterium]|nr:glucokinase [Syntrophales bacterium]